MLTLPIFTLPSYSAASSSSTGAIILQGPHHSAQKSTTTGVVDFKTSCGKIFHRQCDHIRNHTSPSLNSRNYFRAKRTHHQQKDTHESGDADDHGHHGQHGIKRADRARAGGRLAAREPLALWPEPAQADGPRQCQAGLRSPRVRPPSGRMLAEESGSWAPQQRAVRQMARRWQAQRPWGQRLWAAATGA